MTAGELEEIFRFAIDDRIGEGLIRKSDFYSQLNEAIEEACIRKDLLFDSSSKFCALEIIADKSEYPINCSIYAINYATVNGGKSSLAIVDKHYLDNECPEWRTLRGEPKYLIQYDNNKVVLSPKPDANYSLSLEVYRLPLKTIECESDIPEIHKKHHKDLINWCLYRSINNPDIDIYLPGKALEYLDKFEKVFGHSVDADNKREWHQNIDHHVSAVV